MNKVGCQKNHAKRRRNQIVFCICVVTLPLIQYLIFYWGVNFNSLRLAFSEYVGEGKYTFNGFNNFRDILEKISTQRQWRTYFINSYFIWFLTAILYSPFGWIVAYFIYKKGHVGKTFKLLMFFPSMLSTMVTSTIFVYFADNALPEMCRSLFNMDMKTGFLSGDPQTAFWTIIISGFFAGAGASMLIYVNAMNGISESIVEAAQLDGVTFFSELIYITFPMCFPIYKQMFVLGVVGILGNQFGLFEYYGDAAPTDIQTIGYYLYINTITYGDSVYPQLSALGIMMTLVTVPTVLLIRALLNKLDPMEGQ